MSVARNEEKRRLSLGRPGSYGDGNKGETCKRERGGLTREGEGESRKNKSWKPVVSKTVRDQLCQVGQDEDCI